MQWSSHRWLLSIRLAATCGLLLSAANFFDVAAAETASSNVIVRPNVPEKYRKELSQKLQSISGWPGLSFDQTGKLRLQSTEVRRGSATARELLANAIEGKNLIVLESVQARSDVVFCRVDLGRWNSSHPPAPTTYVILIDFADFKHVSGDGEARAAFDIGWAVLHELDHVVNDSADPAVAETDGDCESNINLMRKELGLAVRLSYYFSFLPLKSDLDLVSKFVRLPFEGRDPRSLKRKRYWLIWDAALVGGLTPASQTASLQTSLRSSDQ